MSSETPAQHSDQKPATNHLANTTNDDISTAPIPPLRLAEIATEACDSTFKDVTSYDHSLTAAWNTSIIKETLRAITSTFSTPPQPPSHKFVINSIIIEHNTSPSSHEKPPNTQDQDMMNVDNDLLPRESKISRRGMHSATGAFWDNTKDGCWSFKYEKGEGKGFDVVVSVIWVSVD